ncbi:MAG: trypsin-like serine protease, partial [Archangium sp.]
MKSLRLVLSVACLAMVACEPSAPPLELSNASIRERTASNEEAIQNGTLDTTSSNVVAILIGGGQGGICTGSLIAPNLVLTARHCVGTINQGNLGSCSATPFGATPYAANSFRITTSPTAAAAVFTGQAQWPTVNNTTWFTGAQVILAPTPGNTICGGDIALIRLSANINNVCPLIPRVDSQLSTNEGYTAIGYGITSPNGQTAGTRYKVTGMTVFCAGNCLSSGESGMSDTYEWFGGAQSQKGTCEGDSGGPSLDSLGRVTGAVSRGDATACNSTVYSGVFGHAQWIKDQTILAASSGGFTAPAWATGGSTTVNPCGAVDGGTGGGTGATGGGTGATGGGGGTTNQCGSGEYCAAIGSGGQSACITTSNGIPSSATQCSQTVGCASGFSCWGTSSTSGVCLRDCTGGVPPVGGGSGSTGGGSGTTGGGSGTTGTCPANQVCIDASGEGDFACVGSGNTIPATAVDCTSSGTCTTGYSCWGVSQT